MGSGEKGRKEFTISFSSFPKRLIRLPIRLRFLLLLQRLCSRRNIIIPIIIHERFLLRLLLFVFLAVSSAGRFIRLIKLIRCRFIARVWGFVTISRYLGLVRRLLWLFAFETG